MRDDVYNLLCDLLDATKRYQMEKSEITVQMTIDEYVSLWSPYRLMVLGQKIDSGKIKSYLRNRDYRPVCGWRSREDRASGVMTVHNARIMMAKEQLAMFQIKAGEKHTAQTREKMRKPKSNKHKRSMRKPKSDAHRAEMKLAAERRWAKVRAAKEAQHRVLNACAESLR